MDFFQNLGLDQAMLTTIKELLIVLGIGLLLGLEREYSKQEKVERLFAGVRTFPIVALIGYLALLLADQFFSLIYAVAFTGILIIVALAYSRTQKEDVGSTTEFSLIIAFILGSLVYAKHYHLAVTVAVIVTTLLTLKIRIHEAVHKLSQKDIFSILYFIIITALVLPLLPDEDFGPYGVLNPYKIWLIVSIFVALNFLAYFLAKFFDHQRSIILTGILGGFASSTATAWYFSRQSGKSEQGGIIQAAAIILASSIMFPRLLIWLLIFNMSLFNTLWLPVILFGALGVGVGYYLSNKGMGKQPESKHQIENPINFREALFFAFIYIVIQLVVGFAEEQYGSEGVYLAAGISGLTDIDAITISLADYGKESVSRNVAAVAILIAAFSNTIVKYAFCLIFGNANMKRHVSYAFLPLFAMGIGYILFLLLP
jgi:uncharacterized membrane protein (DUF4010 family)